MYLARVTVVRLLVFLGECFLICAVRVAKKGWFDVFVEVN